MKERPILFSGPMVRALLNGSKTQTRRIVKNAPAFAGDEANSAAGHAGEYFEKLACPYGVPSDRLWVKETHRFFDQVWAADAMESAVQYRADNEVRGCVDRKVIAKPTPANGDWKPSIFCTRQASRIDLEITDVRVERLNDISKADAITEGIETGEYGFKLYGELEKINQWTKADPVWSYQTLWESINGAGSWALSPWVWVISFRRINA